MMKKKDWKIRENKISTVESEFPDEYSKTGWYWKTEGSESFILKDQSPIKTDFNLTNHFNQNIPS